MERRRWLRAGSRRVHLLGHIVGLEGNVWAPVAATQMTSYVRGWRGKIERNPLEKPRVRHIHVLHVAYRPSQVGKVELSRNESPQAYRLLGTMHQGNLIPTNDCPMEPKDDRGKEARKTRLVTTPRRGQVACLPNAHLVIESRVGRRRSSPCRI